MLVAEAIANAGDTQPTPWKYYLRTFYWTVHYVFFLFHIYIFVSLGGDILNFEPAPSPAPHHVFLISSLTKSSNLVIEESEHMTYNFTFTVNAEKKCNYFIMCPGSFMKNSTQKTVLNHLLSCHPAFLPMTLCHHSSTSQLCCPSVSHCHWFREAGCVKVKAELILYVNKFASP